MLRLANKVAVITGGNSGVGKAAALLFAKQGAKVVIGDVTKADSVVDKIRSEGGDAVALKTDCNKLIKQFIIILFLALAKDKLIILFLFGKKLAKDKLIRMIIVGKILKCFIIFQLSFCKNSSYLIWWNSFFFINCLLQITYTIS